MSVRRPPGCSCADGRGGSIQCVYHYPHLGRRYNEARDLDDARTNRVTERPEDYLSPDEQAFLAAERAAEKQACPACGRTGVRG